MITIIETNINPDLNDRNTTIDDRNPDINDQNIDVLLVINYVLYGALPRREGQVSTACECANH